MVTIHNYTLLLKNFPLEWEIIIQDTHYDSARKNNNS